VWGGAVRPLERAQEGNVRRQQDSTNRFPQALRVYMRPEGHSCTFNVIEMYKALRSKEFM
jgi:hypothetical protein